MPKRKCVFNDRLKESFKSFVDGRDVSEAKCIVCDCYVSVANKGSYDLKAHLDTTKHKSRIASSAVSSSNNLSNFVINKNTPEILKVSAVEGTLAFHTVVHHHSFQSMDCTPAILRCMFDDSNTAKKISCARTKTEAIVNNVLAPHSLKVMIECLKCIPFISIATDASNHGNTKMFPVLIQYYDYLNGGINIKLIDLKNTKNETSDTVRTRELLLESLNKNNIKSKCVTFVGDNTNTNFGGINCKSGQNIFSKLKSSVNKNLLGIGCPAQILHNAIHHGVDQFDMFDIESIILKIFNYFSIYTVRTESLKDFCEFTDITYRELLYHSKTRWLSLFPAINRILQMFPALKSYFVSQDQTPRALLNFFENDFSEPFLLFVHSLMSTFHNSLEKIENESNSICEIINIVENILTSLKCRTTEKFIPLAVKARIKHLRENGEEIARDNFIGHCLCIYSSTTSYLEKWTMSLMQFKVFKWMDIQKSAPIDYNEVEEYITFLKSLNVFIDDVQLFDQIQNLKTFISIQDDAYFLEKSPNKNHEALYNHGSRDYRDQQQRQTAWEEIGKELKISGNLAKQRWENLSRSFCNARNRRRDESKSGSAYKKKSSWKFEQQMSFIIPFLESRKTQGNLNESNLFAEPENLSEESEAEDLASFSPLNRENEQDSQADQTSDFHSAFKESDILEKRNEPVETLKRFKKQKQHTTPAGQLVELIKESSALRKRQHEEKKTHQAAIKPDSVLDTLDDTDLFFLGMSRMMKQLPKVEQSQIKLQLSNSVLSAEIRCNQQSFSSTRYPCSIQPQSFASSPSPALSQEYSSGEYSTNPETNNRMTVLEMVSLPQSQYQ
ncbi:hypothetical protein QTP88_021283 [Uroleucon formosanum]